MKKAFIGILLFISIFLIGCQKKNKEVELIMLSNSGSTKQWEYSINDEDIVGLKEKYASSVGKDINSGIIENHYIFEGKKAGTVIIKFEYKSLIDGTVSDTREYEVMVLEDLSLSIKENK